MTLRRMSDIILALALLFICLPALVMSCFAVWIEHSISPLSRVERVTRDGRILGIYRLRTTVTTAYGTRVTELGAFLRGLHLDQIPQLFNVLNGELSLMGDKPAFGDELGSKSLLALREP